MNYLESQKKKEDERVSRLGQPVSNDAEEEAPAFVPLSPPVAPATPVAPAEPKKETAPKSPSKPKAPKSDKPAPPKPKKSKTEAGDIAGKDRVNFYLSHKVSTGLRIVAAMTRKPLSYVIEKSLDASITRNYRCNDPNCTANFAILDEAKPPKCCPVCGCANISYNNVPAEW